jgi:hypothetical protein
MRLAVPSLIIFSYIVASLIAQMPCRLSVKAAIGTGFLLVSMKYPLYEKIGGSFIAPDLPSLLLLILEALYAAMVILFFLLLIKDSLAVLLWIGRYLGTPWRLPFSPAVRSVGLIVFAIALGIFGTWQSLRVPDVRTIEITLPKIPMHLNGFSIVQLSDIHIGPFLKRDWLCRVVEKTNALIPDLVVLTGDMIDGDPEKLIDDIAPLGDLRARYGVFGITGNHEYYFEVEKWLPVFKKLGITMLHNEHKTLSLANGANLVIAGVPDQTERRFGGPGPDIQKALEGAPDATRILMAHRPNGVPGDIRADLQLSGHTHGGLLFFLKWLLAAFNGGLVEGLYDVDGMKLYVSPGTGLWAGFSCRLGVPSEITHIVLHGQDKVAEKN